MDAPRIFANNPIELVHSLVARQLCLVYVHPLKLIALVNSAAPMIDPLVECFTDVALSNRINPATLNKRLVCSSDRVGDPVYHVVASVFPVVPKAPIVVLMTDTSEIILVVQTDSARHEDGTIQIYGAEPGLSMFTPKQLKTQRSPKLMYGTSMKVLKYQERDGEGVWLGRPMTMSFESGGRVVLPPNQIAVGQEWELEAEPAPVVVSILSVTSKWVLCMVPDGTSLPPMAIDTFRKKATQSVTIPGNFHGARD
jgi:hypothetical protein